MEPNYHRFLMSPRTVTLMLDALTAMSSRVVFIIPVATENAALSVGVNSFPVVVWMKNKMTIFS